MKAKPTIQFLVGDDVLRAIGHVALQWAYFETQFDNLLEVLLDQPTVENERIVPAQSFQKRAEQFRSAAKTVLKGQDRPLNSLLSILTDAASLRGFRDDIVHGHWKLHRQRGELTTGIRVVQRRPHLRVDEKRFTAKKAEDVAAKISVATLKLMAWRHAYVQDAST